MSSDKPFSELCHRRKLQLVRDGDPRVPADFVVRPRGRPRGIPVSMETRFRISRALNGTGDYDTYAARQVAKALDTLLKVYGSREAIIQELQRG